MVERRHQIDLKYNKIDETKVLQMMKTFKMLEDEGVIDGMEYFRRTGDREGAIERMNKTGSIKLDPGAQFSLQKREIAPGVSIDNVVITSPDGKHSFNQYDTMVGSLNPKEALSFKTDMGIKLADLALKKTAEENLKTYRDGMVNLKNLEYNELVRHHQAVEKVNMARMQQIAEDRGDAAAARALKNREEASKTAFTTILQSYGVSKEMTEEKLMMLPKDKQAQYRNNIVAAATAHAMWSMNLDPKNKEGITPAEATMLTKNIASMPEDQLKRDSNGYAFIEYKGKPVYLPLPPEIKKEPAPAPEPTARPGVTPPPSAPSAGASPGQGIGTPSEPSPGVTRPAGLSSSDPMERNRALRAQQQSQQQADLLRFGDQLRGSLPSMTREQAYAAQSDPRFGSLPSDLKVAIYKLVNQR